MVHVFMRIFTTILPKALLIPPNSPTQMLTDCIVPVVVSKNPQIVKKHQSNELKSVIGLVRGSGIIGSAYVEVEGSKIVCSLVGPRLGAKDSLQACSLESGTFECEVNFASFLPTSSGKCLINCLYNLTLDFDG